MTGIFMFGLGSPKKNVGIQLNAWMNDVSEQSDFSFGIKIHRYLNYGTRIAVGANHYYYLNNAKVDEHWYVVMSHDFSANFGKDAMLGKVAMSAGYGNGRFINYGLPENWLSELGFFGAISIQLHKNLKWDTEWDGLSLNTGIRYNGTLLGIPVGVFIGAADLAKTYSEDIRMMASFGIAQDLW